MFSQEIHSRGDNFTLPGFPKLYESSVPVLEPSHLTFTEWILFSWPNPNWWVWYEGSKFGKQRKLEKKKGLRSKKRKKKKKDRIKSL